ncbi:MAG TPA: hypothetical protein VJX47_09370 [Candidatus Sulfotelmatobacter sp.]|nr:hypothetical protein [Candidatus Sulfotelmatobacter sp.]
MKTMPWITLILFATQLSAQSSIPAGTILPVQLNSSLNSRKLSTGQVITARVMQDVPLPSGSKIRAGAKVIGHVTAVKLANGAQVSLRFDTLVAGHHQIPVTTDLRALASMMAVEEAQIPAFGPDRGTSEDAWTTEQIGGEVVYRGGGPVANGLQFVGKPAPNGVLVQVSSKPGSECRGDIGGDDRMQALWVFSSDACGAYGFANVAITHAGRTNPRGEIILTADHGDLNVRGGSGMLLRVIGERNESVKARLIRDLRFGGEDGMPRAVRCMQDRPWHGPDRGAKT